MPNLIKQTKKTNRQAAPLCAPVHALHIQHRPEETDAFIYSPEGLHALK